MVLNRDSPSADAAAEFWRSRRVLVTGHTGFKGTWLVHQLARFGAEVTGYALDPEEGALFERAETASLCSDVRADVRDEGALRRTIAAARPEVVFHLAAQALVLTSYEAPIDTFDVNVMGTARLLEALRSAPDVRSIVVVTTDKCYDNDDRGQPFPESAPLGGSDPYSASKAGAELVVASYRKSFYAESAAGLASARAGNVIGGGDACKNRIVVDLARAFAKGEPLLVRNPLATRPFQHVLEPLYGYLRLAARLSDGDVSVRRAFNFGPDVSDVWSVERLVTRAAELWGNGARWELDPAAFPHEARALSLDVSLAREVLGVVPRWPLEVGLERTVEFYRALAQGAAARQLIEADLVAFAATAAITS